VLRLGLGNESEVVLPTAYCLLSTAYCLYDETRPWGRVAGREKRLIELVGKAPSGFLNRREGGSPSSIGPGTVTS
jgi:hypothetical protein